MSYVLENGDQIQVNTNKNQKPNENWLKMVITSKARTRIKQALKEANKIQADYGKEELFRKLSNSKLDFEENIDFLVKHFGFKNRFELFLAISLDQIKIDLKKFKIDGSKLSEFKEVQKVKTEEVSDELGNTYYTINPTKNKSLLLINGESADKFSFQFASCCHPLPGDDIFAFVTTANTLKIHRTSCPNSEHLLASYGYRVLKADWTNVATTAFVEELIIIGSDNGPGIIQSITENINKFGLNIKSFKIDGNEGIFEGTVKLEMQNLDQMNALIRTLKNLPYVSNVRRGN